MPRCTETVVDLSGLTVVEAPAGPEVDLGSLDGVHVLVLLRHRH